MKKLKINAVVGLLLLSLKLSGQGSQPYIGQIMWVPYNFVPKNWAACNGQLLAIQQNPALFSLIGTWFGGNGSTNFALPDMRGRTIMGESENYPVGSLNGSETVTLLISEMPAHTHTVTAIKVEGNQNVPSGNFFADTKAGDPEYSDAVANTTMNPTMLTTVGFGEPHNNMQPYGTLKCIISLYGIYPPRP
ncbi:MAG: tail fiber protein [Weeksellaceae bacterium]|nr:tail fiber protein [Weeksellaceae bacterium]